MNDNIERAIQDAAQTVLVQTATLPELKATKPAGELLGLAKLMDVPVKVTVEVGRVRLPLSEIVALGPGALLSLDREAHEPADVLVNGKLVARGEVVTIDGHYGVRITSVIAAD